MRFTLDIETDNVDVVALHNTAVAEALIKVADRVMWGTDEDQGVVLDRNGNVIGTWKLN